MNPRLSDKDLYTIDALPICDHAIDICLKDVHCHEKFEDFKKKCKTRDRKCISENR
jgi:hypothetical protein